jgi:hypothetical protein
MCHVVPGPGKFLQVTNDSHRHLLLDWIGRRKTLLVYAVIFTVGAVCNSRFTFTPPFGPYMLTYAGTGITN